MEDAAAPAPGSICHIEIPTTNIAESAAFYTAVFGWTVQESVPFPDYWFFSAENTGGGFTTETKPSEDGTVLVVAVEDIPAKLDQIEDAGGARLTEKTEIGADMGFYAYFRDPCGSKVGLWSQT